VEQEKTEPQHPAPIEDTGAPSATASTPSRTERTFLIQRYSTANWPEVKGEVPFLATGPRFFGWTTKSSLDRHGYYVFPPSLRMELEELGENNEMNREVAAQALLEEGIVQALWVKHTSESDRLGVSVRHLASEIPKAGQLGEAVVEFLCGLSDPGHFRSYVAEDRIELEPLVL
jgi:hypothetical protein